MGENAKGSAATVSGTPRSLISLKGIGKPLQIGAFAKRNWTPASIHIVSKLVSSYGAGDLILQYLCGFKGIFVSYLLFSYEHCHCFI